MFSFWDPPASSRVFPRENPLSSFLTRWVQRRGSARVFKPILSCICSFSTTPLMWLARGAEFPVYAYVYTRTKYTCAHTKLEWNKKKGRERKDRVYRWKNPTTTSSTFSAFPGSPSPFFVYTVPLGWLDNVQEQPLQPEPIPLRFLPFRSIRRHHRAANHSAANVLSVLLSPFAADAGESAAKK